ncbi:hypothetical protein GCM10010502_11920 [Kitasatospora aureofaciens]|uniref:Uncharacterized protein n=1 Tax=Kitasatospora aureofaciens TaxID=1894 RepID=A0A8H9HFW7_KITAU|nr:hypothetical protein GCM10010502_11920 [Kitasatospora aureofaciens]
MAGPGPSSKVSATVRPPEAVEPITLVAVPGWAGGGAGVPVAGVVAGEVVRAVAAGWAGALGVPDAPGVPDVPDALGVPDVPDTPDVPGFAAADGAAGPEPVAPSEPVAGAVVEAAVPVGCCWGEAEPGVAAAVVGCSAPLAVPHADRPRTAATAMQPATSRLRPAAGRAGRTGRAGRAGRIGWAGRRRAAFRCMAAAPEGREGCRSIGPSVRTTG